MKLQKQLLKSKIDSINVNNKVSTDKQEVPNIMNTHFCNIGENLKLKIPFEPNPLTLILNLVILLR